MAVKELFVSERPVVFTNPRQARRIDPRFRYSRLSTATYWDAEGKRQTAPAGQLRLNHDPVTRDYLGPLFEPEGMNAFNQSVSLTGTWVGSSSVVTLEGNWFNGSVPYYRLHPFSTNNYATIGTIAPFTQFAAGQTVTFSFLAKGLNFPLSGARGFAAVITGVASNGAVLSPAQNYYNNFIITSNSCLPSTVPLSSGTYFSNLKTRTRLIADEIYEVSMTATLTATTYLHANIWYGAFTGSNSTDPGILYVSSPQLEPGPRRTSFIPTTTAPVTRSADLLTISDTALPSSGTAYIDYTAINTEAGSTLISLANASNQMVNLSVRKEAATYNSEALLASYQNTIKPSLPLQVPTTSRSQSIFTWGANNYQHAKDLSRYATSLAGSVPSNLNRISLGHDAVDPTKAFNGYIHSFYLWRGEMLPDVAEAYVRSDLITVNADTYTPTGPSGSLALVVNTQGSNADGSKVFTLPATRATSIAATALVTGQTYRILSLGTSNFTLAGAATNTVGTVFVATGTTTGTGTVAYQNDLVVTWGDGTESGLEGTAAEIGAVGLAHTYPSAGIYPVWVTGRMQDFRFQNSVDAGDLLRIESWGTTEMLVAPTTMNGAFHGCKNLAFIPSSGLPNTAAVTDWTNAFNGCAALAGTFPSFNTTAATNLSNAWSGCSALTSFPLINTSACTLFVQTWLNCTGLTSFPLINTSLGTNFTQAWDGCASLTSFPLINTASATIIQFAWRNCSSLTSFPLVNTSNVTNANNAWLGCASLTAFPLLDLSKVTDFQNCWLGCASLSSFPAINTVAATNMLQTWFNCTGLTSFPAINTSNVTNFTGTWYQCTSLTSFPTIDTSKGTNFNNTWYGNAFTSFPSLAFTSAVVGASSAGAVIGFYRAWRACVNLTTFPANMFNTVTTTHFEEAFTGCALTAASIENILVSINTANTSNGRLGLGGGTNAAKTTWTGPANTAYDALVARGWTITFNA